MFSHLPIVNSRNPCDPPRCPPWNCSPLRMSPVTRRRRNTATVTRCGVLLVMYCPRVTLSQPGGVLSKELQTKVYMKVCNQGEGPY